MSYSVYGAGAAVALIAAVSVVGAVDGSHWQRTKASISVIDRNCQIIESTYDADYKRKSSRVYTDSCSSIEEWSKVRDKRTKDVAGTAVVHLNYSAPGTGKPQTAELKFDGHDDEFYKLKAGDELEILVNESDPTKVRKA